MQTVKDYLEGLSNEELFNEYVGQYREWQKTGVLQDGLIRTIDDKLVEIDECHHIIDAQRMFTEECTKRFAAMMIMVGIKIDKYKGVLETLKENQSNKVPNDTYDYETDLKNTAEVIADLKKMKS